MKYVIFLSLFVSSAHGSESWFCTTESSKIQGSSIYACGVGESHKESVARKEALKDAKDEFSALCDGSDDCHGKEVSMNPQRTTCELKNGIYKCYRLVVFSIGSGTSKVAQQKIYTVKDFWPDMQ